MLIGELRRDSASRGPLHEPGLDQERLIHVFDGVFFLSDGGRQRVDAHRATRKLIHHRQEQHRVHFVEPDGINFQHAQGLFSHRLRNPTMGFYLSVIPHPAEKTVRDSHIRQELDVIVLAIKRPGQQMLFNPKSDDMINSGDQIVVMGQPGRLRKLEELAKQ